MAWDRRIQAGQAGGGMSARFTQVGRQRALGMYADWTDRIAKGELPSATPQRPQGRERNVVITMWDWADPKVYLHDEIASDKRNPTVNANGPIYGALEESGDYFPVVDPKTNTATPGQADRPRSRHTPAPRISRRPRRRRTGATKRSGTARPRCTASRWTSRAACGRPRASANRRRRPGASAGSDHPSAKLFPINQRQRGLMHVRPEDEDSSRRSTRASRWGHVNFDENDVLWSSFGPAGVEGWFDIEVWDKTHDEKQSQGWTAFVLDNNGNGKRDAYTEPNQPADPAKDSRLNVTFYGDSPAYDGSIWGTVQGMPGRARPRRAWRASA